MKAGESEHLKIEGIEFTVTKIAESPDYRYPAPLVNTHRVSWNLGERTGSFTCIDYYGKCYAVAFNLTKGRSNV